MQQTKLLHKSVEGENCFIQVYNLQALFLTISQQLVHGSKEVFKVVSFKVNSLLNFVN